MTDERLDLVEQLSSELEDFFEMEGITLVLLYGSAARKTEVPSSDIDILVVTEDMGKEKAAPIFSKVKELNSHDEGLKSKLHLQTPKPLSKIMSLVLDGEPWVTTALKDSRALYDPKGILPIFKNYLDEHVSMKERFKAERLMERADSLSINIRELQLQILEHFCEAATEIAQTLLFFEDKMILKKSEIAEELEENYKDLLGDSVDDYKELVDLEKKASRGVLSEFNAENIKYYWGKVKTMSKKVESFISASTKVKSK